MKVEYGGKPSLKFVGLKSNMYSILDGGNNERITSKGHIGFIDFQEFHNTLFKKKILRHTMRRMGPKNHTLGTYETNKISLSCLMINDIFSKTELIYQHMDIKTYKND